MDERARVKALLGNFRPKLTVGFDRDAYIPPGYAGWCHQCKLPFKTLEETTRHVREIHQLKG